MNVNHENNMNALENLLERKSESKLKLKELKDRMKVTQKVIRTINKEIKIQTKRVQRERFKNYKFDVEVTAHRLRRLASDTVKRFDTLEEARQEDVNSIASQFSVSSGAVDEITGKMFAVSVEGLRTEIMVWAMRSPVTNDRHPEIKPRMKAWYFVSTEVEKLFSAPYDAKKKAEKNKPKKMTAKQRKELELKELDKKIEEEKITLETLTLERMAKEMDKEMDKDDNYIEAANKNG